MAEVQLAFYKTPAQAEVLGRTITKEVSLSEAQARVIRDYYNSLAEGSGSAFETFVDVMVDLITITTKNAFAIAISVAAGLFTDLTFTSYYEQLANKFDMITSDSPVKCTATYSYRRHGSNDGAYWITNIQVIE